MVRKQATFNNTRAVWYALPNVVFGTAHGTKLESQEENTRRPGGGAKQSGAYYTPDSVVRSLLKWAVQDPGDRLLDPACGDGRFVANHTKSVGIELNSDSSAIAMRRAPSALIHTGDFFAWAGSTHETFECAAGNPPFIRYQLFSGVVRKRALALCARLGAKFSGLASSWPLFLVATAHLIRPGGRMAFVVPAEIGHAPYSAPLVRYLTANFGRVHIIAIKRKIFPKLSEDCWLLFADKKGNRTKNICLTALPKFEFRETPPPIGTRLEIRVWEEKWNKRLRPLLMATPVQDLYQSMSSESSGTRLGDLARINIGYVSGANEFFHLRPSEVAKFGIPNDCLQTTVRSSRALPPLQLNHRVVERWLREDRKTLLLRLDRDQVLPRAVKAYLGTSQAEKASTTYKCRTREPWYVVPDIKIPDFFLSYMSGRRVSLVRNSAGCACTNALHSVQVKSKESLQRIKTATRSPFFQLSCEIEGHPLGGGMLKLEPREACNIVVPWEIQLSDADTRIIQEGITELQSWRHYEVT